MATHTRPNRPPLSPPHTRAHAPQPVPTACSPPPNTHAQITLRLVEHFYFKTQAVYAAMRKLTIAQQLAAQAAAPDGAEGEAVEEPDEVVEVKVGV